MDISEDMRVSTVVAGPHLPPAVLTATFAARDYVPGALTQPGPGNNAFISLGCALAKLLHFNILQLGGGYERTCKRITLIDTRI